MKKLFFLSSIVIAHAACGMDLGTGMTRSASREGLAEIASSADWLTVVSGDAVLMPEPVGLIRVINPDDDRPTPMTVFCRGRSSCPTPHMQLIDAAEDGILEDAMLKELLAQGALTSGCYDDVCSGDCALHAASMAGHADGVKLLLAHDIGDWRTALVVGVNADQADVVKAALDCMRVLLPTDTSFLRVAAAYALEKHDDEMGARVQTALSSIDALPCRPSSVCEVVTARTDDYFQAIAAARPKEKRICKSEAEMLGPVFNAPSPVVAYSYHHKHKHHSRPS